MKRFSLIASAKSWFVAALTRPSTVINLHPVYVLDSINLKSYYTASHLFSTNKSTVQKP